MRQLAKDLNIISANSGNPNLTPAQTQTFVNAAAQTVLKTGGVAADPENLAVTVDLKAIVNRFATEQAEALSIKKWRFIFNLGLFQFELRCFRNWL